MPDTLTIPSPIFYEALAAAAQCEPQDAYDHFHTMQGKQAYNHRVEAFLEEYGSSAA